MSATADPLILITPAIIEVGMLHTAKDSVEDTIRVIASTVAIGVGNRRSASLSGQSKQGR
jgi:hypothetical protein